MPPTCAGQSVIGFPRVVARGAHGERGCSAARWRPPMETLLLGREDIERVVTMRDAVEAVERPQRGGDPSAECVTPGPDAKEEPIAT